MRFASPWILLLLIFAPLFWDRLRYRFFGQRNQGIAYASPVMLGAVPPSPRVRYRDPILSVLRTTIYVLLVVAAARPQFGTRFRETEQLARDVMLVLDLSGSMQAMDFLVQGKRVDRLSALKSVVKEFIAGRQGDRMGLVVFGDQVYTQCPLTPDYRALQSFVDNLDVGMAGDATAIGEALILALKQLSRLQAKSKVIVLVTDGKNNSGSISPAQAAQAARDLGIRVHAIGIGGNEPAPFPVRTFTGEVRLVPRLIEYDEKTLREIADITGGEYFNAKDTEGLKSIYKQIDSLEQRTAKSYEFVEYEELYAPFVLAALLLLVVDLLLRATLLLKPTELTL